MGTYVGSSQIWTYVHGEHAGPPTAAELAQMQDLVREAMQQGALGVASSLSGPPGSWIDTGTLIAMCKAAPEYGGIYSTHMRTEGKGVFESVAEAIDIGRDAGVPVDIIHLKIADHELWGRCRNWWPASRKRAPTARKSRPMCIRIARDKTILPPSFRPGRMKAVPRPCSND